MNSESRSRPNAENSGLYRATVRNFPRDLLQIRCKCSKRFLRLSTTIVAMRCPGAPTRLPHEAAPDEA